jgi:hypothetical protein
MVRVAALAPGDGPILSLQTACRARSTTVVLGRVDELFDEDPCSHEMNKRQKGLAQFLIPRGNTPKLLEVIEESFHLLA